MSAAGRWLLAGAFALLSLGGPATVCDAAQPTPLTIARSGRLPGDPIINHAGSIRGVKYTSLTGGKPVTAQALFGARMQPQGLDAHQGRFGDKSGHAGDCYLIATMAAYAQFHPEVIKNVFLQRDGSLRTSPGGRPMARFFERSRATGDWKTADPAIYDGRAPVRTSMNKLAFGKLVDKDRIWSPMLEYSYAKFRNQQGGAVKSDDPDKDRSGWNRIANGGYPNHVMQALTGKPTETVYVDPHKEDELWNTLKAAQAKNQVVVVGSMSEDRMKARVHDEIADGHRDGRSKTMSVDEDRWVDGHAYTAWGDKDHPFVFERDGERMIRLRNPWGVAPTGGSGKDGVGEISFKQFVLRHDVVWIGANTAKD